MRTNVLPSARLAQDRSKYEGITSPRMPYSGYADLREARDKSKQVLLPTHCPYL